MSDDPDAGSKQQRGGKSGDDLQEGANPTGSPSSTRDWDTPESPDK